VIRACSAIVLLAILAAGCATGMPRLGAPDAMDTNSDRLILVMAEDPDIDRVDLRGARSGVYRQPRRYPGLPAQIAGAMQDLATEHGLTRIDHWPMLSLGVQCFVFEAPPQADVEGLVARLAADPRVESAQRMNRFELQSSVGDSAWNDPYRGLQRSLDALEIAEAHRSSTGRGVRIAVIDTGVAVSHPDLAGQVAESKDFIGDADAGNRHGTAVAGIIASQAGNRLGIVGIAPGARLLALRACEQKQAAGAGQCTTFDLARAIDYAIGAEADVLNLSLGGPRDALLERLLARAMEGDVVVIAAKGEGEAAFPAAMSGVIAVSDGMRATPASALVAPGVDVLSLAPPDGYDYFSGSSIAAAQVTGIVALLLERAPKLRAPEIRQLLARTARRPVAPGRDTQMQVSACAALAGVGASLRCAAGAGRAASADTRASETD
jgi:subtilisin family serine protease